MIRRFAAFSTLLLFSLLCGATLHAADLLPAHQCLPEETVAVFRIPDGLKFVEEFRGKTKFGAMLLSNKRLEGIMNLIRENAGEDFGEFTKALGNFNLKIDDFPKLFSKEMGYALVIEPRRDDESVVVGLSWVEPDTDLGTRLLAAIEQAVKENSEEIRRVDFQIDGHDVMQLTKSLRGAAEEEQFDFSDLQGLNTEQIRQKLNEKREQAANAKQVDLDQSHVFITRIGDRLLVAHTFVGKATKVRKLLAENPDKPIDFAAITGLEQAKAVFARFISAHSGAAAGLTPRVMATPGLAAALPDGLPAIEILFNPDPLLKAAGQSDADAQAMRVLKILGVDRVGPGAVRMTLDRGAMRTGIFLSAPEPRQGLLALLDQPTFAAGETPVWVPSTVMDFGQISFDLGKAYKYISDLAIAELGDTARSAIQQVEQQVQGMLQVDVQTLLSSVGTNHYFLSFPSSTVKITDDNGDEVDMPATRQGFVWQLTDEAPWKRLIQLGSAYSAALPGEILTPAEEQGFVGLRIKNAGAVQAGGVFVGHGYMIVGIGPDVVEPLMASVRTPPDAAASFRSSEVAKRAAALAPREPCMYYQVMDADRMFKELRRTVITAFVAASNPSGPLGAAVAGRAGADEDAQQRFAKIKQLMPSEEELDGTVGVSVGWIIVNQHGLTSQSTFELPPQ